MEFVLINTHKIINILQSFDSIYHETLRIKNIYKKILKHISEKENFPLSEINFKIGLEKDEEIIWKDSFKDILLFDNFFVNIRQNKIIFETDKIYCNIKFKFS